MNAKAQISESQMEKLRTIMETDAHPQAPNYREPQENVNEVYACMSAVQVPVTDPVTFPISAPTEAPTNKPTNKPTQRIRRRRRRSSSSSSDSSDDATSLFAGDKVDGNDDDE